MSFNPDKTEIMLFKNVENSTNFNFYFDGKLIPGSVISKQTKVQEQTLAGPSRHRHI
jgi:hypothetical protein